MIFFAIKRNRIVTMGSKKDIFQKEAFIDIDENGHGLIVDRYNVYILFKDNEPIYVGCSKDVENRLKNHVDKGFDSFMIYDSFFNKQEALNRERKVICSISISPSHKLLNDHGVGFPLNKIKYPVKSES